MAYKLFYNTGENLISTPKNVQNGYNPENSNQDQIINKFCKNYKLITQVDAISSLASEETADSMVVKYWELNSPYETQTATLTNDIDASTPEAEDNPPTLIIDTDNNTLFNPNDLILVQGIYGADLEGLSEASSDLVLYVLARDNNGVTVMAVNGFTVNGVPNCFPDVPGGTELTKIGTAYDLTSNNVSPLMLQITDDYNNCQLFKFSTAQLNDQSPDNPRLTDNEIKEFGTYQFKLEREKTFLFGSKRTVVNANNNKEVLFTDGIWNQVEREYSLELPVNLSMSKLLDILREAFNNGSKYKILFAGTGLFSNICKLGYESAVTPEYKIHITYDVVEIQSGFGTVSVVLNQLFDTVGLGEFGLIIDPNYIKKYTYTPFTIEKSNNIFNFSEASCLVLYNKNAHLKITVR